MQGSPGFCTRVDRSPYWKQDWGRKTWGNLKPKCCSGTEYEFKNILIPSDSSYLKAPYLTLYPAMMPYGVIKFKTYFTSTVSSESIME